MHRLVGQWINITKLLGCVISSELMQHQWYPQPNPRMILARLFSDFFNISPAISGSPSPKTRRLWSGSRYWGNRPNEDHDWFVSLHGAWSGHYWRSLLQKRWRSQFWWANCWCCCPGECWTLSPVHFTPDSAKSKIDQFSQITNWVKVKNKQDSKSSKVLLNSFPNGFTLGFCR